MPTKIDPVTGERTEVSMEEYNGPQKSDHCRRKEREHGRIGPTIERKRYHGTQTVQPTV